MKKVHKNGKELADIAGISKQSFSAYKDTSIPSASVLASWADKLDLNIHWLLLGEGEILRSEEAQHTKDTDKKSEQHEAIQQLEQELLATKNELIVAQKEALLAKEEALSLYRKLYKAQ